jgi:cell shape-determining protein MreC
MISDERLAEIRDYYNKFKHGQYRNLDVQALLNEVERLRTENDRLRAEAVLA